MSYPGNNALSAEVQQRILRSFEQTVALVREGNDSEALLGCEFILGMDPLFQPASVLVERLKDSSRPVSVDDLEASGDGIVAAASDDFDALPDLDSLPSPDDPADTHGTRPMPTVEMTSPQRAAAAAPDPPAAAVGGLHAVVQDLLDRGDLEKVMQIAENQRAAVEADPRLGALVTEAQSRLETAQYVGSFLDAAQRALGEGKTEEAERLIAKAQILDPENPRVETLLRAAKQAQTSASAIEAAAAAESPAIASGGLDSMAMESPLDLPSGDDGGLPDLLRDEDPDDILNVPLSDAMSPPSESAFAETPAEAPPVAAPPAETPSTAAPSTAAPSAEPTPAEPTPAGAPAEGGDRLETLLAEGQAALDRGEFQNAIDIWSRIFLIDIDNGEATERIEEARRRKAEAERQADEVFHEGVGKIESGDLEGARAAFARVLELQPGHAMSSEYLEQIDSGHVPSLAPRAQEQDGEESRALEFDSDEDSPSLEAAVERDRVVAVKKTDRRLMLIGAAVSLLVIVGGFFLFQQRHRLFPNTGESTTAATATSPQIARAASLFDRGKATAAIAVLESIPASDPAHAEAQSLLTQYRAAAAPPEEEVTEAPTGPSAEEVALRTRLVEGARSAFGVGENVRARRYLVRAASIAPLDDEDLNLRGDIDAALVPISDEVEAFERGDWERVLPSLWRKLEEDQGNQDLRLLIVDAYYNLALRALQRGVPRDAAAMLRSALEIEPENPSLGRMLAFAETYESRQQDLLYRIYVKYLPSRS